jgi:hypothetical protein
VAFASCTGLTAIYVKAQTPPECYFNVFYNVSVDIPVHVPCGRETAYKYVDPWNEFKKFTGDLPRINISVQSDNNTMGIAAVTQSNTCTNNTAIIEATPNDGYRFAQWSDGNTNNPRVITVTSDTVFTAIFGISGMLHVSVFSNNTTMGTVTGEGDYAENTTATIKAISHDIDHIFVRWNDGNTNNPRNITVTSDIIFTAMFKEPDVSYNANLRDLVVDHWTSLNPSFNANITNYTVNVSNYITNIHVTGTASHAAATVSGNVTNKTLDVGNNVVNITVTAEDGTTKTYTVTIVRAVSNDATLRSLTVSSGTLTPSFNANTTYYTVNVANSVTHITVTGTANHSGATVSGNVTNKPLEPGYNQMYIIVNAENGSSEFYTVTIIRAAASSEARLSGITLSSGILTPSFDANKTDYTVNVDNEVSSITVTSIPNFGVTVSGDNIYNNAIYKILAEGSNTVTFTTTSADGSATKTYTVTIIRAIYISPEARLSNITVSSGSLRFISHITYYSISVPDEVTHITVIGTPGYNAATVSGNVTNKPLELGYNAINITIIAEDGITTRTYTVGVYRISNDATLRSLTVSSGTLTPSFDANTTYYTVNVGSDVTHITVTGTANHSMATVNGNVTNKTLEVGDNEINITVTSADGSTTKTYTVTVIRGDPSDATLHSLTVSSGTLTPSFNADETNYTVNVANDVTRITVTGTANHSEATVSGNLTNKAIDVGDNEINITVTSANGSTTKTYTVNVHRMSNDATLSSLTLSAGTLSPEFDADITDYTVTVSGEIEYITVTSTANNENATVYYNSTSVPLEEGENTVEVWVIAEDWTFKTYVITVIRADHVFETEAELYGFTTSNGSQITVGGNNIEYAAPCGETSFTFDLQVSPYSTVTVAGVEYYADSDGRITGLPVDISADNVKIIRITAETGGMEKDYTLNINSSLSDNLYYRRWDDVLAINLNPKNNGGYDVTGIRWYRQDGTLVDNAGYIVIEPGTESEYYVEVQTGGKWHRVCDVPQARSTDKIIAYPNPVPRGESVKLELPETFAGGVLDIYDIRGSLVKSKFSLPATSNSINVSECAPGIYLLYITGKEGNRHVIRMIVE